MVRLRSDLSTGVRDSCGRSARRSVATGDPDNLTPRATATGRRDWDPAKLDGDVSRRTRPCQTRGRAILTPAPIGPQPRHVHGYAVPLSIRERRGHTIPGMRVATRDRNRRIVRAQLKCTHSDCTRCHDDRHAHRDQSLAALHARIIPSRSGHFNAPNATPRSPDNGAPAPQESSPTSLAHARVLSRDAKPAP
jgi:hypothetical protein